MRTLNIALLLFQSFVLSACTAQRPVLSSNEYLQRVGSEAAQRDTDECMRRAEAVEREKPKDSVVGNTVASGVVGAAAGSAGGAVVGRAGEGAGIGAAAAAATSLTYGLLRAMFTSDPPSATYKDLVSSCLRGKGYDPIGWR